MRYRPELGIFGNIKALFTEGNKTNNAVFNNKAEADANNIEVQQALTDVDLQMIASEQMQTDLDLRVTVLEMEA